jgi:hypothetical protein
LGPKICSDYLKARFAYKVEACGHYTCGRALFMVLRKRHTIDVNELRDQSILMHNLTNADDVYTIHYDETNNIRRLLVTPNGLNVPELKCFVLGGIARRGPSRDLDYEGLRSALKLQKSTKELKLTHLGKGNFIQLLSSTKVETFLKWLLKEDLFIHYKVLDPLYWSIVDVVDSILTEGRNHQLRMSAAAMKNDLYTILRHDVDHTADLFHRYSYPNVGRQKREAFIAELKDVLEHCRDLIPDFNFQILKGLLQLATSLKSLPYLEDEEPNVLIDGFSDLYLHRICLFKNSWHILDIEETIKTRLAELTLYDGERVLQNYRFVKSEDEPGVQVSDVVVGLLGKCFSYLNCTMEPQLIAARTRLSPLQERNLGVLTELIGLAIDENAAFVEYILSLEDQRKGAILLQQV